MHESRIILSISQLNAEVSQLLAQGFPALWVEGEISNLARPGSGHLYFSLKDKQAQLRCAMFRSKAQALTFKAENGMKVLARGRVGLYEPRGDFQFIIEQLEDAGAGQLQRQFEQLKAQLQAEGLFASEQKKPLPAFPRRIGVITSPTGAAIRDILNVLKRRCPQIPVLIYPVAVQGNTAQGQIVQALKNANRQPVCDVLLLARGGGSLEDLWPFNEESVARAMAASAIPVISGVGHEIDFTIADFVADQRAPTPSAAAELVSPDMPALQQQVQAWQRQLHSHIQRILNRQQQQLARLSQRLQTQQPTRQLQQKAQRLDEMELRLQRLLAKNLSQRQERLHNLQARFQRQSPAQWLLTHQQKLQQWQHHLEQLVRQNIKQQRDRLGLQAARLHAFSPLATLERGYALVLDDTGQLIRSGQQVKPGQPLVNRLADAELVCRVEQITPITAITSVTGKSS